MPAKPPEDMPALPANPGASSPPIEIAPPTSSRAGPDACTGTGTRTGRGPSNATTRLRVRHRTRGGPARATDRDQLASSAQVTSAPDRKPRDCYSSRVTKPGLVPLNERRPFLFRQIVVDHWLGGSAQ